jgi:catechol 2,3-dioxygenase-like lactoylglutathione lyase family enzyme
MVPLLQVFDMPTAIAFYRDVLGFEVVSTSKLRQGHFDWALLKLHGVEPIAIHGRSLWRENMAKRGTAWFARIQSPVRMCHQMSGSTTEAHVRME